MFNKDSQHNEQAFGDSGAFVHKRPAYGFKVKRLLKLAAFDHSAERGRSAFTRIQKELARSQ